MVVSGDNEYDPEDGVVGDHWRRVELHTIFLDRCNVATGLHLNQYFMETEETVINTLRPFRSRNKSERLIDDAVVVLRLWMRMVKWVNTAIMK
jgi:hypothetical protein